MQILAIHIQQATNSRSVRETGETGVGRRYRLEGDARPGDVIALAGGALVRDVNENGVVDGYDRRVARATAARGTLLDVRG